mmetsp:Transcript_65844/g.189856  ORF Transcript_65844/g.189856 Transcript_65844/m.189856 type:complete len:246 (+) Transcript_65844:304-1041(+)
MRWPRNVRARRTDDLPSAVASRPPRRRGAWSHCQYQQRAGTPSASRLEDFRGGCGRAERFSRSSGAAPCLPLTMRVKLPTLPEFAWRRCRSLGCPRSRAPCRAPCRAAGRAQARGGLPQGERGPALCARRWPRRPSRPPAPMELGGVRPRRRGWRPCGGPSPHRQGRVGCRSASATSSRTSRRPLESACRDAALAPNLPLRKTSSSRSWLPDAAWSRRLAQTGAEMEKPGLHQLQPAFDRRHCST